MGLPAGFRVSVNNTPQAKNDSFTFSEDGSTLQYLDVLANDLGGAAKSLWSVHQDDVSTGANEQLIQSGVLEWTTLASGARIAITADGRIAYDSSSIDASAIQSLGEGETFQDVFTYSIRMANGSISTATVSLTYVGENDPATITGLDTGEVTEASETFGFAPAVVYPGSGSPGYVVAPTGFQLVDVNGDGNLDIVSSDFGSGAGGFAVLFGAGDGTFGPFTPVSSPLYKPQQAVVGDINGDGYGDVLTALGEINQIGVATGDGAGNFDPATTFSTGLVFTNDLKLADIDHDGDLDLIVTGHNGGNGIDQIWENDGTGAFSLNQSIQFVAGGGPFQVQVADVNGDGYADIINNNFGIGGNPSSISALLNDGAGNYGSLTSISLAPGVYPLGLAVGDVNGDGTPDFVAADLLNSTNNVIVLVSDGLGGYTQSNYSVPGGGLVDVALADFNNDGALDIVASSSFLNNIGVLLNDGDGGFGPAVIFPVDGDFPVRLATADLNGDGLIDVVAGNQNSNDYSVLLNNGAIIDAGQPYASGTLTVFDVDSGEAKFAAVDAGDLEGIYGDFLFDSDTGAWSYTLDNDDPDTQALISGQTVTDSLTVQSLDGTASAAINVTINGADDFFA